MIALVIAGMVSCGVLGFGVACLVSVSGHGDEHERNLRKKMIRDIEMYRHQCHESYPCNASMVNKICDDVAYIIRSEQV